MQMDTFIKMNDTPVPNLMYEHTSTGKKTQLDQGVDGEKQHSEHGKSPEWFVYTPCCSCWLW
jgi:hypothetical protein